MTRPRALCLFMCALAVFLLAAPALAQERPVVFLHGLASSADTWLGASGRLHQRLMISPHTPTLDWRQPYAWQAQTLGSLSALPGTRTVAIGHSNGGVVAREWSRSRPLSGIVTLGTPHAGAPLVTNFAQWSNVAGATSAYVGLVMHAFSRPSQTSWVIHPVEALIQWAVGYGRTAVFEVAARTAIGIVHPVTADMRPGSAFLASLNSTTNLSREAATVPQRVGIVSVANNYYWAGPVRAAVPEHADAVAAALYGTIAGLDFWAAWILTNAPHGDPTAVDQAHSLFSLSAHLASLDPLYCAMVSSTSVAQCVPNDGVVPHTTQRYPNALNIVLGTDGGWGPAHTRQTQQSDDALQRALVEVMQVPLRSSTPPPTPPPAPAPSPTPGPGSSPDPGGGTTDRLEPGDVLRPGTLLRSADGRFTFSYQTDGNLVLYEHGTPIWASGTDGRAPGVVYMQHDGNFVMYDANDVPIWSSEGSYGHPGASLVLQGDGNVVIYSVEGIPLWATGTAR